MTTQPPTPGQRRILQLIARVNRRLVGQRATGGGLRYTLVEIHPYAPERVVVADVAAAMVASLEAAGWIVRRRSASEDARGRWYYAVTPVGVTAALR
jgi:hypothetical protein